MALLLLSGFTYLNAQTPAITSVSPTTVCQGDAITITGTDFTGATAVQIGSQPAASFTVQDANTITATVAVNASSGAVTVTTPGGTSNSVNITIQQAPIPSLLDISTADGVFTNCSGSLTYQLGVRNNSSNTTSTDQYTINWGDNTTPFSQTNWAAGAQITHTYGSQGYFNITFTITPANGCTRTASYQFYNGVNPLASITTTNPTTGLCAPSSVEFQIGNWYNNSPGTVYKLNFGDGTPIVTLTHPLNATNTVFLISHTYTTSSCPLPDFKATLQATNACYTTTYTLDQILIRKKPVANFTMPSTVCINSQVCFINTSINGYSGNLCNASTVYQWDFGDGTPTSSAQTPPCHTYAAPGTYTVTLTASNNACGADTKVQTITVLPLSPVPTASPVTYCQGQSAVPLTATGTGLLWYTAATGGTGNPNAPTPSTASAQTLTYYVSQTLPGNCESARIPVTVVITPKPAAPSVSPVSLCLGQSANPLTATGSNLLWYAASTGGTGSSTSPTPSTGSVGSTTYYVSQTVNGCEGNRASLVVTVNPLAAAPVVNATVSYCQGQTPTALTATGTGLLWYTVASGGTGSTTAPVPSTATVGSTIYYVSQTTGCGEGPRSAITVNVNPGLSASISYPSSTLCNAPNTANANPPVAVTITGATNGVFSVVPSSGLTVNSITGTITPAGATPGAYIIRYTIASSGGCPTFVTTASITISGAPSGTISYPANICGSSTNVNATMTGAQGGTFSATPSGLSVDPNTGAINPSLSTPGNYTVTYTIPAVAPCPGLNISTNIHITQPPAASISYTPASLCNAAGSATVPVTLTGDGGGTYSVTPSNGLTVSSGTGTITPAGATPGNYTIKYTIPAAGGCPQFVTTTTVTVNGAPTATLSYPANICGSSTNVNAIFNGSAGGSFSATPSGLSINSNTGAINPSFSTPGTYTVTYSIAAVAPCPGLSITAPVNITQPPAASISYTPSSLCNAAGSATVAVSLVGDPGGSYSVTPATGLTVSSSTGTITASGATPGTYTIKYTIPASGGCPQFVTTTTVMVSGAPSASMSYPANICGSATNVNVTLSGSQGGTFSATPSGLSINPNTGAINPSLSTPGNYTVTYSIAAVAPCPGLSITAPVQITQPPSAGISYTPASLCNVAGSAPVTVSLTGSSGGTYSIAPATGLPINSSTGTITPAGATPGNYTISYIVPASGGCPQFVTSTTVTLSAAPTATITYPANLCTTSPATAVQLSGTQGGGFSSSSGLALNPATGAITPATSTPGTYQITYTIAAAPPCPGYSTQASVTITQAPSATISYGTINICNSANTSGNPNPPLAVTITGTPGGTFSISPATGLPMTTSGTITPAGATPGSYTITYTIPAAGGCASFSTTTQIQVSAAPAATISYPGSPYCKGLTALQAVTLNGTQGGNFSAGQGLSINPTTGAINPSLSTPGVYIVTYNIPAAAPCPGISTTATVEIVASPGISFNITDQSICSGGTATYLPTSTVPNIIYQWSVIGSLPTGIAGTTSGSVNGANPSIALSFTNAGASSQTIQVQVTPVNPATNPCPGAPVTLTLHVNPVPAALVLTDTLHFCMGSPATTLTATAAPGNTVKWYDQNQVLLNAAPVTNTVNAGQLIFFASQTNAYGCEGPKAKTVVVIHPTPKIVSASYTHPTSCGIPSGSIVLNVLDLNNNPIPNQAVIVHYVRFQTALSYAATTDANGRITLALVAGSYSGFYVEIHGCPSQTWPDVFLLQDPSPPAQPVAGYNPPICTGTELHLTASSPTSSQPGPIQYVWAGPAFGPAGDTITSTFVSFPQASVADEGTYVVYAMQNNCISTSTSFQVSIKQSPTKPVISTTTPLCVGKKLSLQASSSIPVPNPVLTYTWTGPGTGFPVNAASASINSVSVTDAGVYSVTVTSPITGCSAVSDTLIEVGENPVVKFTPDTLTLPTGYLLNLDPVIVNASQPHVLPIKTYEWSPVQDLSCNDLLCASPTLTVKNAGCYTVKATNQFECSGSGTICINVFCKESQVFIPNAFLPRGDVPANRKLIVRGTGITTVKSFRVFNRWGEVVFERNNFAPNDPNFGWDGIFKGKYADQGVYVYTVEVICENGTPYFYKGNVTLL